MIRKEQAQYLKMLQEQMQASKVCTFFAGRCNYDPATKNVSADPRRGKVEVKKAMGDNTIDFEWSERNSRNASLTRKIIPSFGEWKKCDDCKDGRVYILQIPQADPLFFWMQEVEETTDEEVAKKINEALGVAGTTEPAVQLDNNELSAFAQAFQQSSGSTNNAAPAPGQQQMNGFQMMQQQMMQQMQEQLRNDPDLQDVYPAERCQDVLEIIASEPENLEALRSHLPPNENGEPLSMEEILEHIQSPEFRAACNRLGAVFRSGEAAPLYSEMGLNTANMRVGVLAFLEAINETFGPQEDDD